MNVTIANNTIIIPKRKSVLSLLRKLDKPIASVRLEGLRSVFFFAIIVSFMSIVAF